MDTTSMIHQLRLQLWDLLYAQWKENLFSAQWWFLVAFIAVSYTLWWRYVDKRRLFEILLFGSFIAVCRTVIEDAGVSSGFWSFDVRLVPLGISLFVNDLTIFPLAFMLVHQYSSTWKQFLVWSAITEGIISFIIHPLLSALAIYREWNWHNYYNFIIMIFIAILSRAVILGVLHTVQKYQSVYSSTPYTKLNPQPALKPLDEESDNQNK